MDYTARNLEDIAKMFDVMAKRCLEKSVSDRFKHSWLAERSAWVAAADILRSTTLVQVPESSAKLADKPNAE